MPRIMRAGKIEARHTQSNGKPFQILTTIFAVPVLDADEADSAIFKINHES